MFILLAPMKATERDKVRMRARYLEKQESERERKRIYYHANKERWNRNMQARRERFGRAFYEYKLTYDMLRAMRLHQDGKCAICQRDIPAEGRSRHIDHDPKTGAVRGLLCPACNTGLGKFRDDPDVLLAAAAYLERS
jgi:hypothetical protein